MSKDETTYPHVDETGRGMDDGTCKHCGVSGSLEGEECPVRLRRLIRRMERWQPYDEHGAPVTQAAYNALLSRQSTHEERVGVIARLTRERDAALARAEKAEAERDEAMAAADDEHSERDRLHSILNRLCAHLPDKPDGTPNWEPTEPEEIAAMVERAERLLADAGDLEVMQAQALGWTAVVHVLEDHEYGTSDPAATVETLIEQAQAAEAERDRLAAVLRDPELLRRLEEYRDALALLDSEPGPESATEHEGAALDLAAELLEVVDREGVTNG